MSTPLKVASAKEVVADAIRARIYDGSLRFGERISIEGLSKTFGISRTPVRDAMWQLSGEGLVTIEPRVGVTIRSITPREIDDVYAIKLALEPLIAMWAAERGDATARAALGPLRDELAAAVAGGDATRYVDTISSCRAALIEMTGSDPMAGAFATLDGRVRLLRYRNLTAPGHMAVSLREYSAIIKAVMAGDGPRAHERMRVHMHKAGERARQVLAVSA